MVCNLLKTWTRVQFAKWTAVQGWDHDFKLSTHVLRPRPATVTFAECVFIYELSFICMICVYAVCSMLYVVRQPKTKTNLIIVLLINACENTPCGYGVEAVTGQQPG